MANTVRSQELGCWQRRNFSSKHFLQSRIGSYGDSFPVGNIHEGSWSCAVTPTITCEPPCPTGSLRMSCGVEGGGTGRRQQRPGPSSGKESTSQLVIVQGSTVQVERLRLRLRLRPDGRPRSCAARGHASQADGDFVSILWPQGTGTGTVLQSTR
jgi:hypothetical protein